MLIISLILTLTLLVGFANSYTSTTTDSDVVFLRRIVVFNDTVNGLSTNTPSFDVPFDWAFTNPPSLQIVIVSIDSHQVTIGKLYLPQYITVHTTYVNVVYYVQYLTTYIVEFSYLAIDFAYATNFYFPTGTATFSNTTTSGSVNISTGLFTLNDSSYVVCFIMSFDGVILPGYIQLKVECDPFIGTNSINTTITFPGYVDGTVTSFGGVYKRVVVTGITVISNAGINVLAGTLQAYNSVQSPTVTITSVYPNDIFFIGLTSFYLPTVILNVGIVPSRIQIELLTPFHEIIYSLIFIRYLSNDPESYLKVLETNIFSNVVSFTYSLTNITEVKLTQFEVNVTWLDSGSITQSDPNYINYNLSLTSAAILSDPIKIYYFYCVGWRNFIKSTELKVILAKSQRTNVIQNTVELYLINAKDVSDKTLSYSSLLALTNTIKNGDNATVSFNYDVQSVNLFQNITYYDSFTSDFASIYFFIPNTNLIRTSTIKTSIKIEITTFPSGLISFLSSFVMYGDCIENFTYQVSGNNLVLSQDYIAANNPLDNTFQGHFKPSPDAISDYQIVFKLITVLYVRTIAGSNTSQIILANLYNPNNYAAQDLTYNIGEISTQKIEISDSKMIVTVLSEINNTSFSLTLKEQTTSYSLIIDDINVVDRFLFINSTKYNNDLIISLQNVDELTSSDLPEIVLNISSISIQSITISDDQERIIISCSYNANIDDQQLDIYYDNDKSTVFQDIVSIKLQYDFPLYYCVGRFQQRTQIYKIYSTTLQYLYLLFFIYSCTCNNKLIAVQSLFLIQLVYYSMIPIGMFCPPFYGIKGMENVSGWNTLFQNVEQKKISYYFSALDFKSNFISNVNIMILIVFLCPIIGGILILAGKINKSYKIRPRLLKYGKSFLYEIPFVILLFNSFNIYISFNIGIQAFGTSNLQSFIPSLIAILLLPIFGLYMFFLNSQFCEFRQQFDPVERIGKISQLTSYKIRKAYPLVISLEYILIPIFLSIPSLFSSNLYIVIAITTCASVFVLFSTPYTHKINNIRLILHRVIVTSISGVLIAFKLMTNENPNEDSFIFWMPLILLVILSLGIIINGGWIIQLSIKWFKKKGIIDHEMKIKAEGSNEKPKPINNNEGVYYPKLQFGRFRRQNMINPKKRKLLKLQGEQYLLQMSNRKRRLNSDYVTN